jgi:hypothetical protein
MLYLREIGCDGVDWIDLAQYRSHWKGGGLVNAVVLSSTELVTCRPSITETVIRRN